MFLKAANQWNTYDITAKGPMFTVVLNGTRTVDGAADSKHPSGYIGLQYGGGVVKFRKVEIRTPVITARAHVRPIKSRRTRRPANPAAGSAETPAVRLTRRGAST